MKIEMNCARKGRKGYEDGKGRKSIPLQVVSPGLGDGSPFKVEKPKS